MVSWLRQPGPKVKLHSMSLGGGRGRTKERGLGGRGGCFHLVGRKQEGGSAGRARVTSSKSIIST